MTDQKEGYKPFAWACLSYQLTTANAYVPQGSQFLHIAEIVVRLSGVNQKFQPAGWQFRGATEMAARQKALTAFEESFAVAKRNAAKRALGSRAEGNTGPDETAFFRLELFPLGDELARLASVFDALTSDLSAEMISAKLED